MIMMIMMIVPYKNNKEHNNNKFWKHRWQNIVTLVILTSLNTDIYKKDRPHLHPSTRIYICFPLHVAFSIRHPAIWQPINSKISWKQDDKHNKCTVSLVPLLLLTTFAKNFLNTVQMPQRMFWTFWITCNIEPFWIIETLQTFRNPGKKTLQKMGNYLPFFPAMKFLIVGADYYLPLL